MSKNVDKNKSENLSSKYSEKLLDHTKQSATDTIKTISKRAIQKKSKSNQWLTQITWLMKWQVSQNIIKK